ncbi:dienelactone hydrolase family protein [Mycobacterium colombiense]
MTAAADKLAADWLTLPTADGPMRLYRVQPTAQNAVTPPAAVIILQEAFGVNDHIQDVTRRVASQGFLAVAPDLFHRSGIDAVEYTDRDTAMRLIGELAAPQIITDIRAVVAHLTETEKIPADKTAIVGFCFGGRAAFTAATALPIPATVVFYGPGIASGPHALLDKVADIKGPVLMFAGDADPTIPPEDLSAIRDAAQRQSLDLRLVMFSGAGHAFHCDARPAQYVADAAQKAWHDTTEFLAETLT